MSQQTRDLQLESMTDLSQTTQLYNSWHGFTRLSKTVEAGGLICLDGGMGSEIQKRNLDLESHKQWFGYPSQLYKPDEVRAVHEDFAKSGAQILISNTYPCNKHVMSNEVLSHDIDDSNTLVVTDALVRQANIAAVKLARDAASKYSTNENPVYVAGSISTHPPRVSESDQRQHKCSPTKLGEWPNADDEYANYLAQAEALRDAGADFIFMEMLKDNDHALRAIKAASTTRLPIFAGITLVIGENNEPVLRDDTSVTLKEAVVLFNAIPGVVGFNIMHCDGGNMDLYIEELRRHYLGIIGVYPELGKLAYPQWTVPEDLQQTPDEFVEEAKSWRSKGAQMIGGCCGYSPEHIKALHEWIEDKPRSPWNLSNWMKKAPAIPEWLHLSSPLSSDAAADSTAEVQKEICAGGNCGEEEEVKEEI